MAWTYSGDPANSDKDAVRFLIGDTDSTDEQLQDAEINWLLSEEGSVTGAALAGAKALIAKFARLADKSVGDLSISYSQRKDSYLALVNQLETRMALRYSVPFAGGISKARKETVQEDSDRVKPSFKRKQFDHPGTSDTDFDTESTG